MKVTGIDLGALEVKDNLPATAKGIVLVSAIFESDGRITDIKIVRGISTKLDSKAMIQVSKIKFTPAKKNGKPVSVRMIMEITLPLQ